MSKRCQLIKYKTKIKAETALHAISREIDDHPDRVYYCSSCRGWHLTSAPIVVGE